MKKEKQDKSNSLKTLLDCENGSLFDLGMTLIKDMDQEDFEEGLKSALNKALDTERNLNKK